jgi:hypothetical protein
MPIGDVVEGALTAGVSRALHTAADAAHHAVSTPATMLVEGTKTATVFIVMGGIKLGCTAAWWLITATAATVGAVVGAGATMTYNHFFPPYEAQPKRLTWNESYDVIGKSGEDSTSLDVSPSVSPTAAAGTLNFTRNVGEID